MTTEYKYFSKHFFRNVFISLLVFFAFCLFIYCNKTEVEASVLKSCIEELPNDYLNIGDFYLEAGKPKSAIETLKKACKNDPDNRGAYLSVIGDIYIDEIGNLEAGIEALEKSYKIQPDWSNCFPLSSAYLKSGKQEEAIEVLNRLIEVNPADSLNYSFLGNVYYIIGRYEEAIDTYKQAIEIKPNYADTHNDLGDAYYMLDRHQEAIKAYKRAIEIKPDDADAHYDLGDAYLQLGNKDLAMEEYKILKILDKGMANELLELTNCPKDELTK